MFTGIPAIDGAIGAILGAIYAIIFSVFFIIGFSGTATPARVLGFE